MKNVIKILGMLGFNEKEVSVYTYLLQNGPSSISKISKGLEIHRPLIYKALSELREKGVLSFLPKGRQKLYAVERPAKLKDLAREISSTLETALPELENIYIKRSQKPEITFLEGRKAITYVFTDVVDRLKKGEVFYRYTSEKDLDKVNSYLPKDYREKRDSKKLERLVISNQTSGLKKSKKLERFIKYMPAEVDPFQQNIIELIYSDTVALIDLNSETSLLIKNKTLADFQKTIFKTLYKKLN